MNLLAGVGVGVGSTVQSYFFSVGGVAGMRD